MNFILLQSWPAGEETSGFSVYFGWGWVFIVTPIVLLTGGLWWRRKKKRKK